MPPPEPLLVLCKAFLNRPCNVERERVGTHNAVLVVLAAAVVEAAHDGIAVTTPIPA